MRILINLASQPFIDLRPLYARLRLVMLALLVAAVPLFFALRHEQRRAEEADARMQTLQASILDMQGRQVGFQRLMAEPENAAVLSQSVFLNQVFARKAFSWTAVMMDLETVLPGGVQVLNIDPIVAADGHVTIRMRVAGPRSLAVDLVRNLEHSHRFLLPRLASESAETAGSNGQAGLQPVSAVSDVDFDVLADYNPLPNLAEAKPFPAPSPQALPAPKGHKHRAAVPAGVGVR